MGPKRGRQISGAFYFQCGIVLVTINICCEWIRIPLQITSFATLDWFVTGSKHCQTEDLWCFLIKWQNSKKVRTVTYKALFTGFPEGMKDQMRVIPWAEMPSKHRTQKRIASKWDSLDKELEKDFSWVLDHHLLPSSFLSFKFEKLNYFCECEKSDPYINK